MYQTIRGRNGHLGLLIVPKNANVVDDVEHLRPVKFSSLLNYVKQYM